MLSRKATDYTDYVQQCISSCKFWSPEEISRKTLKTLCCVPPPPKCITLFSFSLNPEEHNCLINSSLDKLRYCCCAVIKLYLTLCDPMNWRTPGFPVLHYLPEFAQVYVHWFSDDIHPSHPLLPSSPSTFNLFQHQGLFQWVTRWPKYWSFSCSLSPSNEYSGLISLLSKGLSRVFSSTTIQKDQFCAQPSLWSNCYIHTRLLEKTSFDYMDLCQQNIFFFLACCLGLS